MKRIQRTLTVVVVLGLAQIAKAQSNQFPAFDPMAPSTRPVAASTSDNISSMASKSNFNTNNSWLMEDSGRTNGCGANTCGASACQSGACNECDDCGRCVYGSVDALIMGRVNNNTNQPVVILTQDAQGNYPGPVQLTTGDLADSDWSGGARVMVGWQRCCDSAIEFTYFGLWGLDSTRTVTG